MSAIPYRHRSLTLLGVVIVAQVLLLAVQIKRNQQVRLIRVWAVEMVTPLGRAATWMSDGVSGGWSSYIALRHMRAENQQLHDELDRMRLENAQLESRAAEADRLGTLLGFRDVHADVPMMAARVIGNSPDPGSHIVFLDRGSHDGIRRDMGVMTPDGVVGKVLAVYPDTSQVLMLNDKESGVGALLATTRTQGPVRGSGDPLLEMEYVSNDEKAQVGEAVLTSGQDRIFPKDLPVGTVVQAQLDSRSPFQRILIRPAARLDQLEEVLVLLSRQEFVPRKADASTAPNGPTNGLTAPATAGGPTTAAPAAAAAAPGAGPANPANQSNQGTNQRAAAGLPVSHP